MQWCGKLELYALSIHNLQHWFSCAKDVDSKKSEEKKLYHEYGCNRNVYANLQHGEEGMN